VGFGVDLSIQSKERLMINESQLSHTLILIDGFDDKLEGYKLVLKALIANDTHMFGMVRAYYQGRQAYRNGQSPKDDPYVTKALTDNWQDGWCREHVMKVARDQFMDDIKGVKND